MMATLFLSISSSWWLVLIFILLSSKNHHHLISWANPISEATPGSAQVDYFQFMRNTYGRQNLTEIAEEYGLNHFEQNFTDYVKRFNKQYMDSDELEVRRSNFLYSLKIVKDNENDYKQGRVTYKLKINKMADFGINEKIFINQKLLNSRFEQANKPLPFLKKSTFNPWKKFNTSTVSFPTQFDWRSAGMVSPVEDQGTCGSSWIFASVGVIESANAVAGNPLVQLSKQQVLDCVLPPIYLSDGCNGGMIDDAFHYAKQVGLAMDKTYPYKAMQEKCQTMLGEWREWIFRYNYLPLNSSDEVIMWIVYNKGPVVAMLNAGDRHFQLYSGGVLTDGGDKGLESEYNHYVQIIGWGNDNGLDYWLIKNSWGREWGENGYVRLIRGVNNRGINTVVAFAEALPIRQPEPPKPPKPEPASALMQAPHSLNLITFMLSFVIIYTICEY